MNTPDQKLLEAIAGVSLDTQNSDSLDFHEIAVWNLKRMLEEAYQAGQRAGVK